MGSLPLRYDSPAGPEAGYFSRYARYGLAAPRGYLCAWFGDIVWLIGDDWLGADWMYAGVTPFKQHKVGRDGDPIYKYNRDTGEEEAVFESFRFWSDPGPALVNAGYRLFVWGEEGADGKIYAHKVQVKPLATERLPDDAHTGQFRDP